MSEVQFIDKEYAFDGNGVIISQTNLSGIITFANRKFCEVSGYKASELVGKNHNIIRHPDMPKAAFTKMWDKISSGQIWTGIVKNLRKDGLYYWVDTEIIPIYNEENNMSGYIAARKPAALKDVEEYEELYKKMSHDER